MRARILVGLFGAAAAVSLLSSGCGSSNGAGGGSTSTGTAGSGGTGGGMTTTCGAGIDTSACTAVLAASGGDDTTAVQTALIEVDSGGTVCFCPGTFHFTQQLSLTVPSVTVKGMGKIPDDTIFDFSGDMAAGGNDTMLITADGFTIENLWVQNTPGNGVVVRQADKPTFRNLKVSWDANAPLGPGAYAIYPAECTNVLVEDNEVFGAADAAIYVGQGTGAILRNNKAHDSVLGLELENNTNGEAYGNESYNNSGGMAVFLLGDLTKKTAAQNLLHDNDIHDNNHANFGDKSTFVASVPVGTGIIVVGTTGTELRNNTLTNNEGAAVLVVSYTLMTKLVQGAMTDPMIDPDPSNVFVHGNTYMNNGTSPQGALLLLGAGPLQNVLWDGICPSAMPATNDAHFCLGSMGPYPSFLMFAGDHISDPDMGAAERSTDTTPYQCDLPAQDGSGP